MNDGVIFVCLILGLFLVIFYRAKQPIDKRIFKNGLPFRHKLMSHRGGSREYVENTMPAFRYSANVLSVDLLELDVQMTKDGKVVIFHDDNLKRMCGIENKTIGD